MNRLGITLLLSLANFHFACCQLPRVELAQWMQRSYYDVFPICTYGQTVPVTIDLSLQRINFDETSLALSSIWTLYINWTDCNMQWDPTLYGNLTTLEVPLSKAIWKPDLTWVEMTDFKDSFNVVLNKTRTVAQYDGLMILTVPIIIATYCPPDTTMFPFDKATCTLTFFSLLHDYTELNFTALYPAANLDNYEDDGIWSMLSADATTGTMLFGSPLRTHDYVKYTLIMQRKPLYYLYFMAFPYVILVVVSLSVYLLPEECGEKVGLVTNQIVCMAVFMSLLSGQICSGTENIPLMGIYFAILFGIVCLVCMTTIYTCHLHAKSESDEVMPPWVKEFFVDFLATKIIYTARQSSDDALDEVKAIELFGLQALRSEWEVLSVVADRVFLIFFSVLTFASTVTFAAIGAAQYS